MAWGGGYNSWVSLTHQEPGQIYKIGEAPVRAIGQGQDAEGCIVLIMHSAKIHDDCLRGSHNKELATWATKGWGGIISLTKAKQWSKNYK